MNDTIRDTLGPYRLAGKGGMGVVYRAEDLRLRHRPGLDLLLRTGGE